MEDKKKGLGVYMKVILALLRLVTWRPVGNYFDAWQQYENRAWTRSDTMIITGQEN